MTDGLGDLAFGKLILLALVLAAPLLAAVFLLLRLAWRARRAKVATGEAGMIGLTGKAHTALAPEGTVFVRGELWAARALTPVAAGDRVRVVGVDGLKLEVEAERDTALARRPVSAISEY